MNISTDISTAASQVSFEKLIETYQSNNMSVLKEAIDVQVMVQDEIASLINQADPNLANNIDILV